MRIEKKISKGGALNIPAHLRRALGINEGDRFEITTDEGGKIIIEKTVGSCAICKGKDGLRKYNKIQICHECRAKMCKEV